MAHRALVLQPHLKAARADKRDPAGRLEEAVCLAHAIDLEVAGGLLVPLASFRPATLLGSGKVQEIGALVGAERISLVIVSHSLSPVQQRNLEKAWGCKVIDRTALILEIFGARARTREGKLQVELAALDYQKGRLVRSWTHLERQRGGFGFLGGPGESQIEVDRRLIRDRMARLKQELEEVKRTRELHRRKRRDVPYPVVALVGYTNAGKSTLFNRLTGAGVLSMDKLFATLDPTMRALKLPSGATAILSDTVGFVSDLPTQLIAAFRATLEEVLEADLLLHVRDASNPDTLAQKEDVEQVLRQLFRTDAMPDNVIEVLNKIDRLAQPASAAMFAESAPGAASVSALTGEGTEWLLAALDGRLGKQFFSEATFTLPLSDGKSYAWLCSHGNVIRREEEDDEQVRVTVRMTPEHIQRFRKRQQEGEANA